MLLGRVPVQFLGRFGIRFKIYYDDNGKDHPAKRILIPLFQSINYTQFVDHPPTSFQKRLWDKFVSISQRVDKIYPPPFTNAIFNINKKKIEGGKKRILLHTHLDGHHGWLGAVAKIWTVDNWITYIKMLHELEYDISIIEWNISAREEIMQECPYLIDKSALNLKELCFEMQTYDCLVSVDSWSKYAASWAEIPQVIIVPDLRNGYFQGFEDMTPEHIVHWWFSGLANNLLVKIIGLEKTFNGKYKYTLENINNLTPVNLFKETENILINS